MKNECKKEINTRLARLEKLKSYISSKYSFFEIFE